MKPQIMFGLDYWAGRPLCATLSFIHNTLGRIFHSKKENNLPEKIIFLELSEMGAAILAYSAISEAKKSYPDARLYFWIFKENAESVYTLNIIPKQNVITIRTGNIFVLFFDVLRSLSRIRKEKIDTLIDMELFSRFTSILAYFSAAKKRIGFHKITLEGLNRADVYTHKVMYNPYNHISKNFIALVKAIEGNYQGPYPKISLEDYTPSVPAVELSVEEIEKIWDKLTKANPLINKKSRIIVLNPGLGEYLFLRKWPVESYRELAEKFLKDENAFVVLIGVKSEAAQAADKDYFSTSPRLINLIGKTTFREMIALCNISSLFISHDSGAVNLASLTPVNTVVLFGPETPVLYAPLKDNKKVLYKNLVCSPCFSAYNHRISTCRDNRCLKAITVDEVYNCSGQF